MRRLASASDATTRRARPRRAPLFQLGVGASAFGNPKPSSGFVSLIGMRQSPRLERARQRAAESAKLIAELKLRIASLRAEGADTTKAAKLLDQLKGTHRMLLEQLALEQAKSR